MVDIGCGAGIDVVLAAHKVGAGGKVVGVDFAPHMIERAKQTAVEAGLTEITEFVVTNLGRVELPDGVADVVISNCVINLSPDKPQVWREIARVLKPGGRVSVSDLALLQPLPREIAEMVEALVGCVAGAVLVEDTERMARQAGLTEIRLEKMTEYIDAMSDWEDPMYRKISQHLPQGTRMSDYVTSLSVHAVKPLAT